MGWDGVVGIAARYGLDGLGIESWWGQNFFSPVQTDLRAHPASYTMGTRFLSQGYMALPTHPSSSAEVKERV